MDLDYNVSSLPNFLFSFFGFRFRRELDNYECELTESDFLPSISFEKFRVVGGGGGALRL